MCVDFKMTNNNCEHRRIKKNYPFGRKSSPQMKCKDCGAPIKPKDVEYRRQQRRRKIRR